LADLVAIYARKRLDRERRRHFRLRLCLRLRRLDLARRALGLGGLRRGLQLGDLGTRQAGEHAVRELREIGVEGCRIVAVLDRVPEQQLGLLVRSAA